MRIVSLNAWGGHLEEPLRDFIRTCQGDVLCLQEVHHTPESAKRVLGHNWGGIVRINLFSELEALLPAYEGSHHAFARHWLNDGECTDLPVRYGIATFISHRFTILDEQVVFIYGKLRNGTYGNHPLPRNMHLVRLADQVTGVSYVVAHFHGLWLRQGRRDTRRHLKQAENVVSALRDFVRADERLIVCGDMNLLPDSLTFVRLRETFGLRELVTHYGFPGTRTIVAREEVRDTYADYMLVSPNVEVLNFHVLDKPEVSDHCPLVLECV